MDDEYLQQLLKELRINLCRDSWHWETDDWCSQDGYSTPNDAYAAFLADYNAGLLQADEAA